MVGCSTQAGNLINECYLERVCHPGPTGKEGHLVCLELLGILEDKFEQYRRLIYLSKLPRSEF